jgi:glycosyltransferase involved in cell wall biosynthesis
LNRIGIVSPSLSTGDAVSNDVLGMYEALRQDRREVRVFAETHNLSGYSVAHSAKVERFLTSGEDLLIYHHARGWSSGLSLLRELPCRKVVKYHNVTPARFFAGFNSTDESLCAAGRAELTTVANSNCDLYLADSAFNRNELIALGADAAKCFVVAPFHHTERLSKVAADEKVLKCFKDGKANILTVGRVVPNKAHLALLEAFALFHFNCNRNSRLLIVGKGGDGLSPYSKLLHRAAQALGLNGAVVFTGEASDAELRSYYQLADAFVIASEHEGFCVPLVEAMAMKVPIAAYASSAIPETIGPAGVVWDERNPYLLAESINSIVTDKALRTNLNAIGWQRYQETFTNQRIRASFLSALSHLS